MWVLFISGPLCFILQVILEALMELLSSVTQNYRKKAEMRCAVQLLCFLEVSARRFDTDTHTQRHTHIHTRGQIAEGGGLR